MSTVIKVENLSKRYRLGVINRDMLYKDLQSRWAKFRGKEDPNAPIGLKHDKRLEHGDEFWALRNVNLEVKEGEILGIIGRNGAGKSTLLKILSQITAPTEGRIKVKGRIASLLEVGTGFHPELTGRENVYLNGAILGMTRKEVTSKFDEIVAFADISEFIDTPVKRYSSGMYVRLAFAVAAHLEPEILIVDEVLAVGDAAFNAKCVAKMREVSKSEGRSIIFVSHNQSAIKALCNAAVLLKEGKVDASGQPEEIYNIYNTLLLSNLSTSYRNDSTDKDRSTPFLHRVDISPPRPQTRGPVEINFYITCPSKHRPSAALYEVAFSILSEQNEPLAQLFSKHHGLSFRLDKDTHIKLSIPSLPLAPGKYIANLWLGRGHEPIDWVQNGLMFEVEPAIYNGHYTEARGYPLLIEGGWSASGLRYPSE